MANRKSVIIKIRRQQTPEAEPHWEEFSLPWKPCMNLHQQEAAYPLSRCISCCCCMEVWPQFNEHTNFVGAAAISQVRLFNTHPTGAALKRERLTALMGDGGIHGCGYAQNCVEI